MSSVLLGGFVCVVVPTSCVFVPVARKLGKQVFGVCTVIVGGEHCSLGWEFSIDRQRVGMQVDKKHDKLWIELPGCVSACVHTCVCERVCVFSLLEIVISVGHLFDFMMMVDHREIELILQDFAFLLKGLTHISKVYSFRSHLTRRKLDVSVRLKNFLALAQK